MYLKPFLSFFPHAYWKGVLSQLQAAPPWPWRHCALHHAVHPSAVVRTRATATWGEIAEDSSVGAAQAGQPGELCRKFVGQLSMEGYYQIWKTKFASYHPFQSRVKQYKGQRYVKIRSSNFASRCRGPTRTDWWRRFKYWKFVYLQCIPTNYWSLSSYQLENKRVVGGPDTWHWIFGR